MVKPIIAGAAALMLVTTITASANSLDRKDFQVAKDIATSVNPYTQFTIFDDISANVKDGVVTLGGWVTMPYKRNDIAKRVALRKTA